MVWRHDAHIPIRRKKDGNTVLQAKSMLPVAAKVIIGRHEAGVTGRASKKREEGLDGRRVVVWLALLP
jgi:hypothetical protein